MLKLVSVCFLFVGLCVSGVSSAKEKPAAKKFRVLCLGDSLTEGYGVAKKDSYPSQVERLISKNKSIEVINGGISGATTAGSLKRLNWHLKGKKKPDVLILALGANDGLRGQDVENSRKNLEETITLAKKNNIKVLLAGMKMPPNYGNKYTRAFEKMFPEMAKKFSLPIIPFLLEGVAAEKNLNLPDGIHPNPRGYAIVAKNVVKHLMPLLESP
ncbi:arylesterase [Oligoflexaceae bacterium]|nr:arylesterase [Oligoflexaceae bacterium]